MIYRDTTPTIGDERSREVEEKAYYTLTIGCDRCNRTVKLGIEGLRGDSTADVFVLDHQLQIGESLQRMGWHVEHAQRYVCDRCGTAQAP